MLTVAMLVGLAAAIVFGAILYWLFFAKEEDGLE
jgi:high-affinity Fe2+/Pb2+ permease